MKTPCLLKQKLLFADCGDICYKYISLLDKKERIEESSPYFLPWKTDDHIFFHVFSLETQENIVIRNTDCLAFVLKCRETK